MKVKNLMMLSAGIILLAACKGKSSYSDVGKYESDGSGSYTDSVITTNADITPKLVKTADMSFKVQSVPQSSEKITAITKQYGGIVMSHKENSSINSTSDKRISSDSVVRISSVYTSAQMTVKVPSIKLDEYLDKVAALGIYVSDRSMDIDDKSLDYLSAQLKLNNRKQLVAQHKKGKVVIKDPSAVINLKDDLVDEQIYNRKIDDAVRYSVINLSFHQSNTIFKEVIANDDPAVYNLPFFKRLVVALSSGWHIFIEAIIMLANLWAFVLLIALAIWYIRVYKRNRSVIAGPIKN